MNIFNWFSKKHIDIDFSKDEDFVSYGFGNSNTYSLVFGINKKSLNVNLTPEQIKTYIVLYLEFIKFM